MATVTAWPGKSFPDHLVAVRGDTMPIGVAVKQAAAGAAWDLSAVPLSWAARDGCGDVVWSGETGSGIAVVSAVAGTATIEVAAADWDAWDAREPRVMAWDLQADVAGVVSTVAFGTITVRADVTR